MREEFIILSAVLPAEFKELTIARLADFAPTTLVSAATVQSRWCEWTDSKHRSHVPSSVLATMWVRQLRQGPPTAAHAAWTSLRFLETHLGSPLRTRSPAVVAWGGLPWGNVAAQADAMTLKQWRCLELALAHVGGGMEFVLATCLLLILLRWLRPDRLA